MKKNLIIYGTGKNFINTVSKEIDDQIFSIVAFADSNPDKHGTLFYDRIVISPEKLCNYEFDIIIIASTFYDEIKSQLINTYHIDSNKIANINYLLSKKIEVRYQKYYEKYKDQHLCKQSDMIGENDKIIIYTAITGNYDELRTPLFIDNRCKYICYTDNMDLKSPVWEIRKLELINNDLNRSAKVIKVLPHLYFKEYDYSIWVDGKFQITGDLIELMKKYKVKSNFLSFMHSSRKTSYDEANVCIELGLDNENTIRQQINRYRLEGYKGDNELIEGGVLFRKHNEINVIRLMEAWWNEIVTGSKRDQLSFNYVAWKEQFVFDLIDLYLYDNKYVKYYKHN